MDSSILDTIKETIKNIFSIIGKTLKKYKKYIFLAIIALIAIFGVFKFIEYLKKAKDTVYLSDEIKEELSCEETNACVFTKTENNYVWYSGYLWRIVEINDNGSIKLILNESVGLTNYYNGLNNDYLESFIRLWLNEGVFLKGLNNPEDFLVDYEFCIGDEKNECNSVIKDKVGLITSDEYEKTGGKEGFMNTGVSFWTSTIKKNSDTEAFIVNEEGELVQVSTGEFYQVKPVINLKSKTLIVPGTKGTKDNPYVLKGDEELTQTNYLVNRYPGEFIKFAGKVWRIIETDAKYTKLVLYGKDTKMSYGENNLYSDNKNTINEYLNNVYYNILKGAEPNLDKYLVTGNLYAGKLSLGDAYTNVKIDSSTYRHQTGKIGILTVGELFSGNDLNLSDEDITWLLTPNDSDVNMVWLSNGKTDVSTNEHAIRPTIYLKEDVYIIAGSGDGRTRETAYEISIKD